MPQYGDFHEHRLHHDHSYASSVSTSVSDNRSFASNSHGLRPSQQFHLPQPIEVDFRNYPQPSSSSSVVWDGLLPNYAYTDTINQNQFRPTQDSVEMTARSETQDPLLDWYRNNDGPWIPRGTVPDIPIDQNQSRTQSSGFGQNNLREADLSEKGVAPLVYLPSDSGYGTRRSFENASVFSSDLLDRNHDGPSLTSQGNEIQSFPTLKASVQQNESEISDSWAGSQPASGGNQNQSDLLQCPTCGKGVKTKSELKKHDLRHKKPFHCSHPGCSRKEGFSTSNDLDRHTRSKHPADSARTPSKVYRCVYPQCKSQSKFWPRLDNFRCHIKRVHQLDGEQLEELVRRSEQRGRLPTSSPSNQNFPQDIRDRQRDMHHRQFLPDLANLDKVSPGQFRSEEPDDDLPEVFDRSRIVKSADTLRLSNHMDFQPGVYRPNDADPLSEHSFGRTRLEMDLDSNNVEGNSGNVSAKEQNYSTTDPDLPDYRKTPGFSSEMEDTALRNLVANPAVTEVLTAALAHTNITEHMTSTKELPNSGTGHRSNTAISGGSSLGHLPISGQKSNQSQTVSLSNQEVQRIGSLRDADQVTRVLEMIKALGYRVHKDPVEEKPEEEQPKKHPTPQPSEDPTVPHSGIRSESLVCSICSKLLDRPCKMKKHMKRHERPYGCTSCGKQFGSKNDWKRHENSQHFQLETWRCDEDKIPYSMSNSFPNSPCAKVCYRKESFREHLVKEHRISDASEVKEKLETCRIGRNCQSRFWCGFCKSIRDLKKRGVDAWTERFNHIDDHFSGRNGFRKQSIKEWVPVDVEGSSAARGEQKSYEVVVLDDDDESDSLSSTSRPQDEVGRAHPTNTNNVTFTPVDWNSQSAKKRQNDNDDNDSGRPMKTARRSLLAKRIICCQCQSPHDIAVVGAGCMVCEDNHRFCDSCFFAEADPCPRGSDR